MLFRCLKSRGGRAGGNPEISSDHSEDVTVHFHIPYRWVPDHFRLGMVRANGPALPQLAKPCAGCRKFGNESMHPSVVRVLSVGAAEVRHQCSFETLPASGRSDNPNLAAAQGLADIVRLGHSGGSFLRERDHQ